MLDEVEGDRFHGAREIYSYMSDVEWSAVERMSSTVGKDEIWSMLSTRDRDQQHSVISKFLQQEADESRAQVNLLQQQNHQRTEELRQHQSQSAQSSRERRPESLKLEISKYHGVENDSLLRGFVEVDGVIEARRIDNERMQVAVAQSYLAGSTSNWSLNLKLDYPNVFGSLEI